MNRIILASLISLASLPTIAAEIDYNGAALDFSTDTTWTLTDLSNIVRSGNFSISNGATLTLIGTLGQSFEWFSAGSINMNGSIYAPGIDLSLTATDSIMLSGSLVANRISIWGNREVALSPDSQTNAGGVISASLTIGSGGFILLPSDPVQSIMIVDNSDPVLSPIVLTAPNIVVGETVYGQGGGSNGAIVLQGPTIEELIQVPLGGSAFYFLGALAPLVARRMRKRN